jgi:TolB-like protein/Flp pilus assembly protein TadD
MKRCPECRRDYNDDSLSFCLDDGSELLFGPASMDEPATAILSEFGVPPLGGSVSEPPTSAGGQFGDEPATAILSVPPEVGLNRSTDESELKTAILQPHATAGGSDPSEERSYSARRNAKPLIAVVVAVAILAGGFFGYRYFAVAKQIESIAVMPFVNDSGNPDVEYLSDGMTETLIKSLSQVPNLAVKSRSTVFFYKGKETSPKNIGEELGVQAVLLGRVGGRGDDLKLSLELVDTKTQDVIWTEQYDRKQSDLVSLQSEIARDVSTKLKSKLSGADEAKVTRSGTASPEAYQAYLKGRYFWNRRTAEDLKKAIEQFDLAVQNDPNYALAYVGLADSYGIAGNFPGSSVKESIPRAKAYATKALEIDDSLGEAYATLGLVNALQWNWAEAEKAYIRSIELNPNYATARQWYSRLLNTLGQKDEALAEIKRANELDPLSMVIISNVAGFYRERGDYQSAIEQNKRIVAISPSYIAVQVTFAEIYLDQKRSAEALAAAEKARDVPVVGVGVLGRAYAQLGRRDEALAAIKTLEEVFANGTNGSATNIAFIYVLLGDKEKTFEWLERAFEARETDLPRFRLGPTFDPIRDDPRYKDLIKRMNLPE